MKRQEQKQQNEVRVSSYQQISSVKIKQIQSANMYPFNISKVTNLIELSYTCLMDRKVGRQQLGIQVVGGYRMLKLKRQEKFLQEKNKDCLQSNFNNESFIVVFILLVDYLQKTQEEQEEQIMTHKHQQPKLYVPYSVFKQFKDMSIRVIHQQWEFSKDSFAQVIRFPIKYGPNIQVTSIDEELEKIIITNLKLPSNQVEANQIKDLITKIIVHPKFSLNMKQQNSNKSSLQTISKQEFQFLIFPQSNNKKVTIDLSWIDENNFLKHLPKCSLKMKTKLVKMKKINDNAIKMRQKNCSKNYLEFEITPSLKNKDLLENDMIYISKFVPGKTLIEFEALSSLNRSLMPFSKNLQLAEIYNKMFTNHQFFIQIRQRILDEIKIDEGKNKIICLKSDKSIGIGALLNDLTQNHLNNKRFVKINCEKFATLNEFFNRLRDTSNDGNTIIFIKNLSWLENLSKNQQVVQDTMKGLIQKISKTLQFSYQFSICHFTCILYFSNNQIPEQLPKNTKRITQHLQKTQKIEILERIFGHMSNKLPLSNSMKETVTNMLINSVGWVKIYKFLLDTVNTTLKGPLNDKALASKIQKTFSLENVQNVAQVSWSDIGGLQTAKEEIIQTVLLPTKHPQIFDEWIRPRTGLLFYGPPGTGKTLLGKCIAKQCKMGFISVKGPQLLNMYVGQSEKNVRQVFELAKESKPCIVFMDELDALVPKRGNSSDSNAVMDRIVAELLMQIDMASQNQVFVIGATNRPDLLDPSILRAGRFDKQIYLGISKNKQDRIKILKAQTRNSKLQGNFDYELIEKNVPMNFTGADFYGLTSKSMMRSVQRSIEQYEKGQVSDPQVLITTQDFLSVIPSVKPSVSEEQLRHYESLKDRFSF